MNTLTTDEENFSGRVLFGSAPPLTRETRLFYQGDFTAYKKVVIDLLSIK